MAKGDLCCGLIKDLKTRYSAIDAKATVIGCGLIKDLKTRYSGVRSSKEETGCGLIKDLKTRYWRRLYRLTIKKLSCYLQIKNASFL